MLVQRPQAVEIEPPLPPQRGVEKLGQPRVRVSQPAARRDPVGHVREALGPQAREILEDGLHQQLRVQRRHAVHLVAADDCQARHAHAALAAFVDQRQPRQKTAVARAMCGREVQQFLVDAEDDLEVARQHMLHQPHRPGFQCLGHQRVVGVGKHLPADSPGRVPCHVMRVAQQAHQLGDADGGMGVVEVDRHLVGQV